MTIVRKTLAMEWMKFGFPDVPNMLEYMPGQQFRVQAAEALRRGSLAEADDTEASLALIPVVRDELVAIARGERRKLDLHPVGGGERRELELAMEALAAALARLGIHYGPAWEGTDGFDQFKRAHAGEEGVGKIRGRYSLLEEQLQCLVTIRAATARGVPPEATESWRDVDGEIAAIRQRFETASSAQDYRDVGNRCVAAQEALGELVYDPDRHLHADEEVPKRDETKNRLERYVEESLAGKENAKVRAVVRPVIELAQSVKHRPIVTRRDAGIIADATILLANILRRCEQVI